MAKLVISKRQMWALTDAKRGPLYRTVSGWRCLGGGLHAPRTVGVLVRHSLLHTYRTGQDRAAAILSARGLATVKALTGPRA